MYYKSNAFNMFYEFKKNSGKINGPKGNCHICVYIDNEKVFENYSHEIQFSEDYNCRAIYWLWEENEFFEYEKYMLYQIAQTNYQKMDYDNYCLTVYNETKDGKPVKIELR